MPGSQLLEASVFLVNIAFGLFIVAVMLRFMLQYVRADFYNPLAQAIVTLTNPLLRPLRRYVPSVSGIDSASILLMFVLQYLNTVIIAMLIGYGAGIFGTAVVAVAELLGKAIWILIAGIFLSALASWIAPGTYNPAMAMIDAITTPVLRPLRRHIPPLNGLDFTPMAALVILYLAILLVVSPLRMLGYTLG